MILIKYLNLVNRWWFSNQINNIVFTTMKWNNEYLNIIFVEKRLKLYNKLKLNKNIQWKMQGNRDLILCEEDIKE